MKTMFVALLLLLSFASAISKGRCAEGGFLMAATAPCLPHNQAIQTGRDRVPEAKRGLKLSLELDGQSYFLRQDPLMSISLKNIGQEPISLYEDMGWGEASSLSLVVTDNRGNGLNTDFIADARDRPPYSPKEFKTIESGDAITFKRRLNLEQEGITSAGSYVVTVYFHSPVTREFVPGKLNVWTTEDGELHSESITFTVK